MVDQQAGLLEDLQQYQLEKAGLKYNDGYVELQAGPKNYSCASGFRFRNQASKYYVDPSSPTAQAEHNELDEKLQSVRNVLNAKAGYLIGAHPIERTVYPDAEPFANEWDYHKAMHDRQHPMGGQPGQPLSEAERRGLR